MSCPSSSGAEFEQQQKQLNEDAEEQVEQGKQILRSLEELRTTQHELINTYIMDAIDKWEALVGHMEAGVSRNPARKAQSKSNILESVLQNTQEKVGALRIQAESLETCAAELYAHSVQLGERAKQLGNKVEDCVAKNLTESTQLIVTWKRGLNQAQVNKKEMNDARDKAFKDRLKASQWETAKDVTKFIPGVNIFAYPLTRYWHNTNHTASTQRVRVHENEGESLEILLQFTHTQLEELHDSRRRLTAIKKIICKTTSHAGLIKLAARTVGQWCAITASSALVTIQAISSVCITLKGADAILHMQDLGNILDALGQHIQQIGLSDEAAYNSSIRGAMSGLEQRLTKLRIAKLAEVHDPKREGLISDMGEL